VPLLGRPATPGLDLPPPEYYSATNPAQGVGVVTGQRITCPVTGQPGICSFLQPPLGPIALPYKVATYLNLGPLRNQGFEASIDHRFSNSVSGFANYSWQDTPEIRPAESGQIPYPVKEVGIPPENRFNVGLNVNTLPVISLGIGFGEDYGIYIVSRAIEEYRRRQRDDLDGALIDGVATAGKAVLYTAFLISAAIAFWAFSPLRFQAEMGYQLLIILTMNMLGGLLLIPALISWIRPRFVLTNAHEAI